ncbi:hypothetical protein Tco_0883333 [Tanacetum coccineum]
MEAPQKTVDEHHRSTHRRSQSGLWFYNDGDEAIIIWMKTRINGEQGFADVRSWCGQFQVRVHDESFGVDDLDLNLNEHVNLNVSQIETQSELPMSEEQDVGRTQEPILAEVSTQAPIYRGKILKQYNDTHKTEYDVQYSEDVGIDDDDDIDKYFLVDDENEIVKPDVECPSLFWVISMDLSFLTSIGGPLILVPADDVLEGELTWMSSMRMFSTVTLRRNLKLYKNDGVRIRARCDRTVFVFTMAQGTGPTGPNRGMEAGPSVSSGPTTRSKKRKNTGTNDDSQASSSVLDVHDKGDLCPWVLYVGKDTFTKNWVVKTHNDTHTCLQSTEIKHYSYKFLSEKIFEQVRVDSDIPVKAVQDQLQRKDYVVELQSTNPNTTVKIAVEKNTDPSLPTSVFQRTYVCLGALKLGFRACRRDLLGLDGFFMKGPFPGQVLVAVGLDSNNKFTHWPMRWLKLKGWCGQAYKDLLWRAASATDVRDFENSKSDLLLNNICEVFNGKIVGGRDKPVIILLEYIREYCMKRIVNVQGVIDKCTGLLTPTATRIIESIKKEAHLMKVQWIRFTWTKYWEKSTCPTTLLPPKHHVQVGRPRKKIKRSKHKDEPFVKDGTLSRKGRTITCQSCGNIGHNKATCKGKGGNNAEASGSTSRQAQQTKPAVGQDGSCGSGAGVVRGLSAAAGEGGPCGIVSETRNADGREMGDGVPTQSSAAGGASEWSFPMGIRHVKPYTLRGGPSTKLGQRWQRLQVIQGLATQHPQEELFDLIEA